MSDFNVVIDGVSYSRINGIVNIQTGLQSSGQFPQYESDTIVDLKYGDVAKQVVEKLTKTGEVSFIKSHTLDTIRNAAYYHGFGISVVGTAKESLGKVDDGWRVKRIVKKSRYKENKHEQAMERLVA